MRYTAGELAKKLGVSARTVRFYDEKELLQPCDYSESGYRLIDAIRKTKDSAEEELDSFFNMLSVEEHENDLYVPDEDGTMYIHKSTGVVICEA